MGKILEVVFKTAQRKSNEKLYFSFSSIFVFFSNESGPTYRGSHNRLDSASEMLSKYFKICPVFLQVTDFRSLTLSCKMHSNILTL